MIGRTVLDRRGGQPECWVLLPEGVERLVQVPDVMRKMVVFLYCTIGGERRAMGTGFFVAYPIPGHEDRTLVFLMTAHHVIAAIKIKSDDGKVLMRLNSKDGGAEWAQGSVDEWLRGEDTSVDFAYLLWKPPDELGIDYRAFNLRQGIATDELIRSQGIGIGDEVFLVGLFRNHLGRDRNEPIVRVGSIAAMPADKIKTKHYGDMRAFLIEARSIGGLSGSPVFVHLGFQRWREGRVMQYTKETPFHLLGIMHGHWEISEAEIDAAEDVTQERINSGIGLVVPGEEIEKAYRDRIEEIAQMARQEIEEGNAPTPDVATEAEDEFGRFEDLTRNLLQVPKDEIDEARKREDERA